jgi:hypothetical protein
MSIEVCIHFCARALLARAFALALALVRLAECPNKPWLQPLTKMSPHKSTDNWANARCALPRRV